MAKLDNNVRSDLVRRGVLYNGYHPEMEHVHNSNADLLLEIIKEHGWPSKDLVGEEAVAAAWLVAQHAISKPDFQRNCLTILKKELSKGNIEAKRVAQLEDRILVFEGKPQVYGTQFDWDDQGMMSPNPIQDPENVDTLRKNIGLPPIKESTEQIRSSVARETQSPADLKKHKDMFLVWARKVGWRK